MQDLNDLYYFVQVVEQAATPRPAGRSECRGRDSVVAS